jgi:hypothetical protein
MRDRHPAAPPEPAVAWLLARVCTLGPGGLGDDDKAIRWAAPDPPDGSSFGEAERSLMLRRRGAVAYRSGRFLEAIDLIRRGIDAADGEVRPEDAAFLAMALYRTGDRVGARAMLARCPQPRDPGAGMLNRSRQSADQLRREAESVLFGEPLPADPFAR